MEKTNVLTTGVLCHWCGSDVSIATFINHEKNSDQTMYFTGCNNPDCMVTGPTRDTPEHALEAYKHFMFPVSRRDDVIVKRILELVAEISALKTKNDLLANALSSEMVKELWTEDATRELKGFLTYAQLAEVGTDALALSFIDDLNAVVNNAGALPHERRVTAERFLHPLLDQLARYQLQEARIKAIFKYTGENLEDKIRQDYLLSLRRALSLDEDVDNDGDGFGLTVRERWEICETIKYIEGLE